jgi:hypothetical protein
MWINSHGDLIVNIYLKQNMELILG